MLDVRTCVTQIRCTGDYILCWGRRNARIEGITSLWHGLSAHDVSTRPHSREHRRGRGALPHTGIRERITEERLSPEGDREAFHHRPPHQCTFTRGDPPVQSRHPGSPGEPVVECRHTWATQEFPQSLTSRWHQLRRLTRGKIGEVPELRVGCLMTIITGRRSTTPTAHPR
jgi:hypothetical protein